MIKTIIYTLCTFLGICAITSAAYTQTAHSDNEYNGFSASIFLGTNFSQLSGDGHSGFHLVGISTGTRVSFSLSVRDELGLGLEYQQYGSNPSLALHNTDDKNLIHLEYLSIPLVYRYKASKGTRDGLWLTGGLAYNRLFGAETEQALISPYLDDFELHDLSLRIGILYKLGRHGGILIDYENALTDILQGTSINQLVGLSRVAFKVGYTYQL